MTPLFQPAPFRGAVQEYGIGSQQALRERNLAVLIRELMDTGSGTQRELAHRTGLSPATVSNLVRILLKHEQVIIESTISSGRRANLVTVSPSAVVNARL